MCRQQKLSKFRVSKMNAIIQLIERSRLICSRVLEMLRISWLDIKDKVSILLSTKKETEELLSNTKPNITCSMSQRSSNLSIAKEDTAKNLIQELYKKKLANIRLKDTTRESKVNLLKETSNNAYNFGKDTISYGHVSNEELEQMRKNRLQTNAVIEQTGQLDRLLEMMQKATGLKDLDRVEMIQNMLFDVKLSLIILAWSSGPISKKNSTEN